jgi:phytol kinase
VRPAPVAFVLAAVAALIGAAEWARRRGASADMTRAALHTAGAAFAATFPIFLGLADALLVGVIVTAVLIWSSVRRSLPSLHGVERTTVGAVALPVGATLAALALWEAPRALTYGLLVLAFADTAASVVGRRVRVGQWRAFGGSKSLGGTAAFFVVALAVTVAFGPSPGAVALCATAAALALIEAVLPYGLDNLALPLAGGLLGRAWLGL